MRVPAPDSATNYLPGWEGSRGLVTTEFIASTDITGPPVMSLVLSGDQSPEQTSETTQQGGPGAPHALRPGRCGTRPGGPQHSLGGVHVPAPSSTSSSPVEVFKRKPGPLPGKAGDSGNLGFLTQLLPAWVRGRHNFFRCISLEQSR